MLQSKAVARFVIPSEARDLPDGRLNTQAN